MNRIMYADDTAILSDSKEELKELRRIERKRQRIWSYSKLLKNENNESD